MQVTDNKVVHLDPNNEKLVIMFTCLLRADTMQKVRDEIMEQVKSGVVVLPPYCAAFVVKNESEIDFIDKED